MAMLTLRILEKDIDRTLLLLHVYQFRNSSASVPNGFYPPKCNNL